MKCTIVFVIIDFCSLKSTFVVHKRRRIASENTFFQPKSLYIEFKLDVYREMVTVPSFVFVTYKSA